MTEVRTVSSTGGEKGTKEARYDLIPVEALEQVAILYGRGAAKYAEHNWRRGYEWSKSYAALQRHINAFWRGEDNDPEMETPHLASVVFHALTLMTFMEEQRGFDDRFNPLAEREKRQSEEALAVLREKLIGNPVTVSSEFIHQNFMDPQPFEDAIMQSVEAKKEMLQNGPHSRS